MSWIINGVYIPDDDCISKPTSDEDNVKSISPSININWNNN